MTGFGCVFLPKDADLFFLLQDLDHIPIIFSLESNSHF